MDLPLAQTREQMLWSAEVARVLAAASTLEPGVRSAVRATLYALAGDSATDEAMRRDVLTMLSALEPGRPPSERRVRSLLGQPPTEAARLTA